MRKTLLYEARANYKTTENADCWLGTCRTLYNISLDQRISSYCHHRKTISVYDQANQLPELKSAFSEFRAAVLSQITGCMNHQSISSGPDGSVRH